MPDVLLWYTEQGYVLVSVASLVTSQGVVHDMKIGRPCAYCEARITKTVSIAYRSTVSSSSTPNKTFSDPGFHRMLGLARKYHSPITFELGA